MAGTKFFLCIMYESSGTLHTICCREIYRSKCLYLQSIHAAIFVIDFIFPWHFTFLCSYCQTVMEITVVFVRACCLFPYFLLIKFHHFKLQNRTSVRDILHSTLWHAYEPNKIVLTISLYFALAYDVNSFTAEKL